MADARNAAVAVAVGIDGDELGKRVDDRHDYDLFGIVRGVVFMMHKRLTRRYGGRLASSLFVKAVDVDLRGKRLG